MGGKILSDEDAVGLKFGMLTIVSRFGVDKRNHTLWLCECECGMTTVAEIATMRSGNKQSCGCLKTRILKFGSVTHGASAKCASASMKRTCGIWVGMRKRCRDKNCRAYKWYGARGIAVCEEWDDFRNFLADMGEISAPLTLERLDVNGPYSKANCFLIPLNKQAENKTTTIRVTYDGVVWCLKSLCRHLNLPYLRTYKRYITRGWSLERALQP